MGRGGGLRFLLGFQTDDGRTAMAMLSVPPFGWYVSTTKRTHEKMERPSMNICMAVGSESEWNQFGVDGIRLLWNELKKGTQSIDTPAVNQSHVDIRSIDRSALDQRTPRPHTTLLLTG